MKVTLSGIGDGRMTNRALALRRLRSQWVSGATVRAPAEVVRKLGAVQAQDYSQFLWAVGVRARGAGAADVEQAVADGQIVLTWAMRGTLHAVPAEDVYWMLERLTPRVLAGDRRRREQLDLGPEQIAFCERLIYGALKERKRMSRQELMDLLENEGFRTQPQRGYHVLWHLAQTGLICMGPKDGKQQTFVLLEDWVRGGRKLPADEALGELARRYFAGHGPALLHDFAWWAGLSVKEARSGIDAAGDALRSEMIDGAEYWTSAGDEGGDEAGAAEEAVSVHLLPGFDEYLLGYKDRSAMLEAEHAPLIAPGGNGIFAPMLVIDGFICGTWKRTLTKKGAELSVRPFSEIGDWRDRIEEEARRYGDFVGMPLAKAEIEAG